MKQLQIRLKNRLIMAALLAGVFALQSNLAYGETEISLDDENPTPTPVASKATPAAKPPDTKTNPTPTPANKITLVTAASPTPVIEIDEATPTPAIVHGILKAKDVYAAGIKSYKKRDYDQAIRYLKKSLTMHDPYTPKFYHAEANAMLGVIYQFHIIHPGRAYRYYQAALKIDRHTRTAKKHLREVYKYRHRKD